MGDYKKVRNEVKNLSKKAYNDYVNNLFAKQDNKRSFWSFGTFSNSQCVIVKGFEEHENQETTKDKLEIFLTKQRNGGGDVKQIVYPFGNSTSKALAIFYDTNVARSLIKAKKMSDGKGQSLGIYPFEKETFSISQGVIVKGFEEHESEEQTKDKLEIILTRQKNGGGDVEKILYPFGKSTNTAVAVFTKTEVASSLIKAQIISDGKGQNLKIYPLKVCQQMKTFILELGEAVVQLEPTLKDHIFSAIDVKGRFLKDGQKLMLDEEEDICRVYKHVSDRIKGLLSSYLLKVTGEDNSNIPHDDLKRMAGKSKQAGSADSQQVDRPDFLVYQFFKNCHKDKVKEIESSHDVTITWMPDKNELAVQSNKPGDDTDRKVAEERFRDLYQKIHPIIKQLQVEDVQRVEAQKAENKITRKHADVLILPKEYVFIGSEDNVELAIKDFKMLCEITTFERSLQDDAGLLLTDVEYTIGGVKVIIRHGDITNENVDVIVNAANGELQHGSGVAKAIAMKAGRRIHEEGQRLLKKRRHALNVSEALHTNGYNLKAKYVLHAVGPRYGKNPNFQSLLKKTFLNCLEYADEILEATSIAVPLISSGVFGGNKEECAKLLCESICQSVQSEKCQNLKTICLVNIDVEATTAIQDMFKKYCVENWGQSCQTTNVRSLQSRLATSTLPRAETFSRNLYSTQTVHKERIDFTQTAVHQNTHSKDQMSKVRDGSKFEVPSYDEQNKRNNIQEQTSNRAWQPFTSTNNAATHTAGSVAMDEEEKCPICFDKLTTTMKRLPCGHKFCRNCIEKALSMKPVCPICGKVLGALIGNQPRGSMKTLYCSNFSLPGYTGCGYIEITYDIPSGIQTHEHPHPGKAYYGTWRKAYLPDNRDGRYVASLLRKAFDARLIFTIGTSVTTGASDSVTWNDIHHKTSVSGGPNNYGYPDPTYLRRVREELAAKGIK
ncbi:uncharacterized protein LOC117124335 [Anneissia japonica]|uniref:uncharacterized protein LOC117124335 n=1 Tax=Anneissia japonica TaxID=1529436 RepID=UPI0014256554|nr:uncharacterized protein LOC117124335 [Anneissia japonica]